MSRPGIPRLGLCCMFRDVPIKFRTATATALLRHSRPKQLERLAELCLANAVALQRALEYCAAHNIGCFRINSQILPCKTHPQVGYHIDELPDFDTIISAFRRCGDFTREHQLRTSFHPDQFVVLNSLRGDVVERSIEELDYQAEVALWVGADVINIHAGGAFGDKQSALNRFERRLERLSERVRQRLTVENDDKIFSPFDLLPVCRAAGVPLVYDVHHHRCLSDKLTVEAATEQAMGTWNREAMFHISSPVDGWAGPKPERHHDFIDLADFPVIWRRTDITVEVEAKAKEAAVAQLRRQLIGPSIGR